ncbi:MAG: MMPL family transporter, partial [Nitrospirota bacterium]|nr:MMPL family transporter [Nitrospirota bacterium]
TAALAALTVGRLNLISVTFAVLFVGLGVDFGIHLVLRYRETLDRLGAHQEALGTAVVGVGGALSLSALCAALGFLSFSPTSYLGLAELGLISAGGMAVAWWTSLTVLPALLCLMPLRPQKHQAPSSDDEPDWLLRHRRAILTAATLTGLTALAALPFVRFDSDPLNLKDPASESVMTFRNLAADSSTSPHGVDILTSDLGEAEAMAARLEALPEVDHAVTLASLVPEDQAEKLELIDAMAFYLGALLEPATPSSPIDPSARHVAFEKLQDKLGETATAQKGGAARLAATLARLEPRLGNTDAPLGELEQRLLVHLPGLLKRLRQALSAEPVSLEGLPDNLRRQWLSAAGEARVLAQPAVQIEDNADLADFAQAILAAVPTATGLPIIITEAGKAVTQAFFEASWLALAMITLVLALVLRRP